MVDERLQYRAKSSRLRTPAFCLNRCRGNRRLRALVSNGLARCSHMSPVNVPESALKRESRRVRCLKLVARHWYTVLGFWEIAVALTEEWG